MDPAQVPLVVEAESAASCRPRDVGPRRRVLGERQRPGVVLVDLAVQPLEERDGREVLVAAELVGLPLPGSRMKSSRIIDSTPSTLRPSK